MAKSSIDIKPWERQPRESPQAFEAFDLYCKMGAERSLRKVAQKLTKSDTLIRRWSSNWNWQTRSREYDNELQRQELKKARNEQQKMRKRHIGQAQLFQQKALEALKDLDVSSLKPDMILRFFSEASKIEAMSQAAGTEQATADSGGDSQSSLANTIIDAYRKRMEGWQGD